MIEGEPYDDRGTQIPSPASYRQVYSTLQQNEIRTLLLAPGTGDGEIEVQLGVVSSTRVQQYEALSYVWGSARPDYRIRCNEVPFSVTGSLYTALLHLRYVDTWRRLWVDQICIDQANEDEIMNQVTRMGSIYADSSRVVVWLGRKDRTLSKAWKVIEETCLSISLVRSDFLDSPPPSTGKPAQKASTEHSPPNGRKHRTHEYRYFRAASGSSRDSHSSHNATTPIVRPLRSSMNNSDSSLSSSTSSLSSVSSSNHSQPPRTPIRKRTSRPAATANSIKIASSPQSSSPMVEQYSKLKLALPVFQHAYFTRLWTFQEIVLSPAAIFVSDGIEFALADLMGWYFHYVTKPAFSMSHPATNKSQMSHHDPMVYDSVGSFENVIHIRHQIAKAQELSHSLDFENASSSDLMHTIKFSTLLMLTRQLQTLKAEDRVLSLLGLHKGFADYLGAITEAEGWLPVPELFLAAFRYCVEVERSLDILSAAGVYAGNERKGFERWPSWLPDWREGYPLRPMVLENTKTVSGNASANLSLAEGQTTETEASLTIHQTSSSKEISALFSEDDYGKFSLRIRGYRLGIVLIKPNSWPGRFLVADAQIQADLEAKEVRPTKHSQGIDAILTASSDKPLLSTYANTILTNAQAHSQICRPLRTSATVEPGDWVCILLGGAVLYILRPTEQPSATDIYAKVDTSTFADTSVDNDETNPRPSNQVSYSQCRFIGECAITAYMDGTLASKMVGSNDSPVMMEFELI